MTTITQRGVIQAAHRTNRHRTIMWCELLKAILEHRPVSLLERNRRTPRPKTKPATPQLSLPL